MPLDSRKYLAGAVIALILVGCYLVLFRGGKAASSSEVPSNSAKTNEGAEVGHSKTERLPETSMRKEPQPKNTLQVARDGKLVLFPVSQAAYNWKREGHGVEFTLACKAGEVSGQDFPPKVEVTIILDDEPKIEAGAQWNKQPAYIDKDPLYNLSNYYEWTHEGFEDFSVSIMEVGNNKMLCRLTGYVSLNRSVDVPVLVSIVAEFLRDESLARSVQ